MLLKLPKEIIFNILRFLKFHDKLNLVKTCRDWRDVILESHLYEELPSFEGKFNFRNALDFFRNHPAYGSQVERLDLKIRHIPIEDMNQIPVVFPKIKEFRSLNGPWKINESETKTLLNWKDTLNLFDIYIGELDITHLLNNSVFSRLSHVITYLPLSFSNDYVIRTRTMDTNNKTGTKNRVQAPIRKQKFEFLDCFKYTPALRHLELYNGDLFVEDLEKLHTVCPQLTSLSLAMGTLYAGDISTLPLMIEPVTQLLSFKFWNNLQVDNEKNGVLNYLTAKYTKLNELLLLFKFDDDPPPLRYRHYDEDEDDIENVVICDEHLRQRKAFLSTIPSTVKILKLNAYGFKDPVEGLKETDLDPIELGFYNCESHDELFPYAAVTLTEQLDYFRNLDSLKTLTLEWDNVMECNNDGKYVLDNISNLTVQIRDCELEYNRYTFDSIFLIFPVLETLMVTKKSKYSNKIHPISIKKPLDRKVYPKLRKLSIDQPFLDRGIIDFVRTAFPNLKELRLSVGYHLFSYSYSYFNTDLYYPYKRPSINTNVDVIINLEGCNLDVLDVLPFVEIQKEYHSPFYLQVRTLDELKNYNATISNKDVVEKIIELEDKVSKKKIIGIICDNVKSLKMNGSDIKELLNRIS